jgi:hypothetical protein
LPPLPKHISGPEDLVTPHTKIREGFLRQALEKTRRVTPHIAEAKRLSKALHSVKRVEDLLQMPELGNQLISAAGFSLKAKGHLSKAELDSAIKRVLEEVKSQAGDDFREEIVYRYMLIMGDALGGSMRNVTGAAAGISFAKAIMDALRKKGVRHKIKQSSSGKIVRIEWPTRTLLFDRKPKFIDKNIDCILLDNGSGDKTEAQLLEVRESYRACGELKGGIDPAGADEHWKTANGALDRIRSSFSPKRPVLFFAAAAIVPGMAKEIFDQLTNGRLSHAANITDPDQLADLADWIVRL